MKCFKQIIGMSVAVAASFAFAIDGHAAGGGGGGGGGSTICSPGKICFPDHGDDTAFSLGQFRIAVAPKFQPFLTGAPGFDSTTGKLTSPLLFDPATRIGRSDPIVANSPEDVNGVPVGTLGTIVKDSNYVLKPVGFDDPSATNTREVHTQIIDFDLGRFGAGAHIRAGLSAPDRPASYGEVEAIDPSGKANNDFPAKSFFDVFVDVDLPGLPLYNKDPLLIENSTLAGFPPTVVYTHGGSTAVSILFREDDPTGHFKKDDVFGYLVLAGHGIGFAPAGHGHGGEPGEVEFETELNRHGELPVPNMPVPEPSSMLLMVAGLAGLIGFSARRRARSTV